MEKDEFWKKTIEKKRKSRELEIVMLSYLLISSFFMIYWKHREIAFMFRKHILGHNITVIDNKVVDLDNPIVQQKIEAERKYIYTYEGEKIGEGTKEDYWKYQNYINERERKKNTSRKICTIQNGCLSKLEYYEKIEPKEKRLDLVIEYPESINPDGKIRAPVKVNYYKEKPIGQRINCWTDKNGNMLYSNTMPVGKNMFPCE